MSAVEALRLAGWGKIFLEDEQQWNLLSPKFNSLEKFRNIGAQLIAVFMTELQKMGADQAEVDYWRQAFSSTLVHELMHACADSQLSEKGAAFLIKPGQEIQPDQPIFFPFQYYPVGGRTPMDWAIIAAGPGPDEMSNSDWQTLSSCLHDMGMTFESHPDEVRKIFHIAEEKVRENWERLNSP